LESIFPNERGAKRFLLHQRGSLMKVYVYISDTKVDMLYSQIAQTDRGILKKIATELRIDLKILDL